MNTFSFYMLSFVGIVIICRKRPEDPIKYVLTQMFLNCPQLRGISLSRCSNEVDDDIITHLSKQCKNLTTINVAGCYKITESGLLQLLLTNVHVKSLDLTWCIEISDKHLKILAQNVPNLVNLTLTGCKNITDEGLKHVAFYCKKIKHLDISVCGKLTNESILSVLKHCSELKSLNLSWCKRFL